MGIYQVGFRPFRHDVRWRDIEYPGAQIIAFLCDIVPATPPLDDPGTRGASSKAAAADATKPAQRTQQSPHRRTQPSPPRQTQRSPRRHAKSTCSWDSLERTLFDLEVAIATRTSFPTKPKTLTDANRYWRPDAEVLRPLLGIYAAKAGDGAFLAFENWACDHSGDVKLQPTDTTFSAALAVERLSEIGNAVLDVDGDNVRRSKPDGPAWNRIDAYTVHACHLRCNAMASLGKAKIRPLKRLMLRWIHGWNVSIPPSGTQTRRIGMIQMPTITGPDTR